MGHAVAMTYARQHLVTPDAPGTYHCVSRCVRRAFLCGFDALSGRSFEHRKRWVESRLLQLAESFAVSIHAYAVMSNHLHVVVHIDPLAVHDWSDEEVARRWLSVYRGPTADGVALEQRVRAVVADEARLAELRSRLGSLSWFMSALVQPIARRSNREDGVSGRFWEGRFKSQALLDERAVLACMAYVDLNPLRAGVAETLEGSQHTSARRRLESRPDPERALQPVAGHLAIPMPGLSEAHYLELLRWSWDAREGTARTVDALPVPARRFVEHPRRWIRQLQATETHYGHAIGSVDALLQRAITCQRRWLRGIGFARMLLVDHRAPG
ncbi:MAG: transposase [Gammaproteobacteria bacterium]